MFCSKKCYKKVYRQRPEVKQKQSTQRKIYDKEHNELKRQWWKKWIEKNREKRKTYVKNRRINNTHYKIMENMRTSARRFAKGISHSSHTIDYIGCSQNDLILYLKRTGKEYIKGIDIDHIKPCSSFDCSEENLEKSLHECFHYTNLRLFMSEDNNSKNDKFDNNHQKIYSFYKLNGALILNALKNGTYNNSMEILIR